MSEKLYTAEESALMFAAACDKVATEILSRKDLSEEEKVRGAVMAVLTLIDIGEARLGVPLMHMHPNIHETSGGELLDEVDFKLPDGEEDIGGQLHEYFREKEALADGHQLLKEFTDNIGAHLMQFGNTTGDTDVG